MEPSGPQVVSSMLLVLDKDPADRRFVEIGLGKASRFQIESAASCAGALEILRGRVVDLILTEVELVDGDAFHLMKQIRARPGGKDLPVIFLTRDKRASVLVSALQSGAVDFIVKPYALPELLARVDAAIMRSRERRADAMKRSYSLAGDLGSIGFADLVHLLEIGNRDGQLFFTTERGVGDIKLQKGRIVDASFGTLSGTEAFYALMREERGRFEFQPGLQGDRVTRTISAPTTSLLMEGARLLDMHKLGPAGGGGKPAADVAKVVEPVAVAGEHAALPAMEPEPDCVASLAQTLADPFSLGELRFLNRGQLRDYLASDESANRCLGLLIVPRLAGVVALAGMSSPLGDEHIAAALDWDQRVLQWRIDAGRGVAMDLILLDCEMPALVLDDMRRRVSLAVYSPQAGDHLGLPHHALGEFVSVVAHLQPRLVMALGNARIGAFLDETWAAAGCKPHVLIKHRPLDDGSTDLRSCLAEAVEAWGQTSEVAK